METDKPQISILMAVYEPRMDWLRLQLQSLNDQTYPNLRLYIRDDCSPTVPFERIQSCVRDCISAFSYELVRNERNLGSNGTFERLTQEAEGALFAYCDQDDIWLPEKLTVLEAALSGDRGALLACSDMEIIDGEGRHVADSITKVRRHHRFRSGENLAPGLLFSNFVSGCTLLVRAEEARAAVPFCPFMVHDQYLALWCAARGSLLSLSRPLIRYRIHGGNQTGMMAGVTDKASYERVRIQAALDKLLWLREFFPGSPQLQATIGEGIVWLQARKRHWARQGGGAALFRYRRFSPLTSLFEEVAPWLPEPVFLWVIGLKRKNIL